MPARVTVSTESPVGSSAMTFAAVPPSLCVHSTPGCTRDAASPLDSASAGSAMVSTTCGPAAANSRPATAATTALAPAGKVLGEQRLQVRRHAPGRHQLVVLGVDRT